MQVTKESKEGEVRSRTRKPCRRKICGLCANASLGTRPISFVNTSSTPRHCALLPAVQVVLLLGMDQQEDVVELEGSSPHSEQADATSSSPSFPFFNHSAATLPNNLPPNADDKPMARQKRKRTSPEDQAVLEAYYARDPKPDKAARLDLVKKVALGEKEVQVSLRLTHLTHAKLSKHL